MYVKLHLLRVGWQSVRRQIASSMPVRVLGYNVVSTSMRRRRRNEIGMTL